MVEAGGLPGAGRVARLASLREAAGHVVRVGRALKILQVTRHACRAGKGVVVVDVAVGTLARGHCVHARQREVHRAVIKRSWRPASCRMARIASLREVAGHVAGVGRALKILQVAGHTGRAGQIVVVVGVTVRAQPRRHGMHAGQRKPSGGMIKLAVAPLHRVVALLTRRREAGVRHRTGGAGKILLVAGIARHAAEVVVVVDVAINALAGRHGMPTGQWESGRVVIELGIQPVIGPVATVTGNGKLGGDVIRVGRGLVIGCMAGIAIRGHRLEFAVGRAFVAGIAVHCGMCAGQREAVVMLLDLLDRDLPAPHRMALLAVGAQLPLVNIRVAILASLPDIGEHGLDVALGAGHRYVHAAQGVPGLVVIEFRNRADRPPPARRVAVLTGNVQIAVRAVRARILRHRSGSGCGNQQQPNPQQIENAPRRQHELPLAPSPRHLGDPRRVMNF